MGWDVVPRHADEGATHQTTSIRDIAARGNPPTPTRLSFFERVEPVGASGSLSAKLAGVEGKIPMACEKAGHEQAP
jgi:hypothetical protein